MTNKYPCSICKKIGYHSYTLREGIFVIERYCNRCYNKFIKNIKGD